MVLGVRGEGKVSQALQPLGGGLGICTPERWQHSAALAIQASKSFSRSQSDTKKTSYFSIYYLEDETLCLWHDVLIRTIRPVTGGADVGMQRIFKGETTQASVQ